MTSIKDIISHFRKNINVFDLELIIAHVLKKPREFVLVHPEKTITNSQGSTINKFAKRRMEHEPLAYILGHKEFYGLDFKVNKNTLIPRPETEMMVDEGLILLRSMLRNKPHDGVTVIDVGTGSGNIIIPIAKSLWTSDVQIPKGHRMSFYGIDISPKALHVARQNAKKHNLDRKIKFIKSDLLDVFIQNTKYKIPDTNFIILANLPYLSEKIYSSVMPDVKNFEPRSALAAKREGLYYYEKLFQQIRSLRNSCYMFHVTCFIEFSPEQKNNLEKLAKKHLPGSKITFKKDLSGRWRFAVISLK